jgi:hypothetical protein
MSDDKKPADESGKELDADQLENVAGGLLPAVSEGVFKFFKQPELAHKIEHKDLGEISITPALKK